MKTKTANRKMNLKEVFSLMILTLMLLQGAAAQEPNNSRNLFRSDVTVSEIWVPEVKFNSIQGKVGTLVGFYGGALINRNFLLGITGGVNLGHPTVNYGYFGGIAQVIVNPEDLVHFSGQLLVAFGTTKDYENPKSGVFDNFWNISGEHFQITEPGVNLEVNLTPGLTFVTGLSYRWVTGIDANNEYVSITHLSSQDMSGINFNIGLKFVKKHKK